MTLVSQLSLATTLETVMPEKLKHLSAHPALDPQSSAVFFSQAFVCGQQSNGMPVADMPAASARTIPPSTGSIATDKATTATKMARQVLMARL
ncbi:MAG: hypothetical protein WA884_15900 [Methyloceanibacter sp.]